MNRFDELNKVGQKKEREMGEEAVLSSCFFILFFLNPLHKFQFPLTPLLQSVCVKGGYFG